MSVDKSNRISDDSGVVCFNTMEDHHQTLNVSSLFPNSSSSAMFLTAERHQKSLTNDSPSLFQYKSVYSNCSSLHSPTSIIPTTVPVKHRQKRGKYVVGSGQAVVAVGDSLEEDSVPESKYGVKRLSHVQQMRMRFENWCNINNEVKRCEASHCKGIKEEQFDSLPIIPFAKGGDKRPLVESPLEAIGVVGTGDKQKPARESPTDPSESPLVCECDNEEQEEGRVEANGNQEEEEGSFRENGKLSMLTE